MVVNTCTNVVDDYAYFLISHSVWLPVSQVDLRFLNLVK
jgi:hypothetical protein